MNWQMTQTAPTAYCLADRWTGNAVLAKEAMYGSMTRNGLLVWSQDSSQREQPTAGSRDVLKIPYAMNILHDLRIGKAI
jgi:hypothetical protein